MSQAVSPEIRAPAKGKAISNEEAFSILRTGVAPFKKPSRQKSQNTEINSQELKKLIEELKKKFDLFSKYLKIEIDDELDIPVVKIVDKETNQVIRQIPPEYLLKIMKNIDQMLGVLVNKKV
ncbi:flagellar protein FlaG protein [Thermosulfurimonas dismutans]|uniref:Flagellar protein FlaG protein n=2 Tax=Thermosulfurimonas dismutans TaxID=999894 RepID=A0A179D323_9BACT|nr:flagellar protein FlaG protein [Thermosulfurimonas dismutans]